MDHTSNPGTAEKTPLQSVQDLHEQVRAFVERERPCQVKSISAISRTTYLAPLEDPTTRVLAQAEISFRVEVIKIASFPGFRGYLTVEVIASVDGSHNSFLLI